MSGVVAVRPNVGTPGTPGTPGTRTVALTGFDNAGNSTTARCPYVVVLPRIAARLNWGANEFTAYTALSGLAVVHAPSGARI